MYTVRQLLQTKGNAIWSVTPKTTVYEALELMAAKNIGALMVMDNDRVVGIFSERDYARKVVLKGLSSKATAIGDLMSTTVSYVSPDDSMEDCMALMTEHRFRHLPVMEEGKLVGIVSIGDAVKAVISDRELKIRELERYITGGHTSQP